MWTLHLVLNAFTRVCVQLKCLKCGNPVFGHPWKPPSMILRTQDCPPLLLELTTQRLISLVTHGTIASGSPVPTVPELYKIHSIIRTLMYRFRKIVCHLWWIQRLCIVLALSLIVLTFLNIVWPWKGPNWDLVVLTGQSTRTGSMSEAPEIRIPPYYRHTLMVSMVSALWGSTVLLNFVFRSNYLLMSCMSPYQKNVLLAHTHT